MTEPSEPETPQSPPSGPMGQYYLLDKIAQGGMAEIYKGLAYDLHGIRRTVVIKKILSHVAAHREFIDMLVTEAKLAVQLTHGNIAQVHDLGKVGDDYFMVMEYVDGRSVSQIMRKTAQTGEAVPIPIAAHIAAEAAAGLHYMHSRTGSDGRPLNIIHRDISPQNLMVTSGGTVKIIDFGIAKAATKIEITDVGVVKGKFAYMSPEQASGDPLDYRTDIFSLAVVLFEMLTGRRLFKGKDNQATLRNVRRANVPLPSLYRHDIPHTLDDIILRALQKRRSERFDSAGALRDALIKFMHQFHPEFHHAEVTHYFNRLFQDDERPERGEESHTPLLIIDRTQSAILPPDEEVVTDDEGRRTRDEHKEEAERGVEAEDAERSEWTPLLSSIPDRSRRQKYLLTGIAAVLGVALAAGLGYWRSRLITARPVSVTSAQQVLPGTDSTAAPAGVEIPQVPVHTPPPVPPEPFGDVVITSEPAGAEIYLDDRPTGLRTPTTLSRLPAESHHTVGLLHKGHKFRSVPVTIHAGGIERLNAALEIDYASLEVLTTPPRAEVIMDGLLAGYTPVHLDRLRPGEVHVIIVKKEGFLEWRREFRTEAGRHTILHPELERDHRAIVPHRTVPVAPLPPPALLPPVK